MTEADVNDLVAKLKQNGCQTLLIRCGCLGVLPYQTKLSYPPRSTPTTFGRILPPPSSRTSNRPSRSAGAQMKRYGEVVEAINPPAAFIRAGHEQGLKVLCWLDIFDDFWPGFRSKFVDEHPYCQWVGKDGKTYFKGLIDYSWPEAREFRLAQAANCSI